MAVFIPSMNMPAHCGLCELSCYDNDDCFVCALSGNKVPDDKLYKDCPLVPINIQEILSAVGVLAISAGLVILLKTVKKHCK